MKLYKFVGFSLFILSATSCGKNFYEDVYADDKKMTLGMVQKELHKGMRQDEVAASLGSPNIVTQDKEGRETWIYDKIATQVRSSGAGGFLFFCSTGADYVSRKDVSQQALTVVVKYNSEKEVDLISYHSSRF
jgi:outer membrane protein assembly factor BamE (lipoprotein component of BamABCDE complex)